MPTPPPQTSHALDYEMKLLAGEPVKLAEKYQNKVVLVVNVASRCGLTGQYQQLQELHEKYAAEGLAVLGFPCNQFLGQEPGSAEEIQQFCRRNYGVEFDMFAKVNVKGKDSCELYKHLTQLETEPQGPGRISWNFEKFLIDRQGHVIARFSPRTSPTDEQVIRSIEAALQGAG